MAKQFVQWLKKAVVEAYDPDREQRLQSLAAILFQELKTKRQNFELQQFTDAHECSARDLREAKKMAYCRLLDNTWKDGVLTPGEKQTLGWVRQRLDLSDADAEELLQRYAADRFGRKLAKATEDSGISDDHYAHLDHIANSVGESASTFARKFFSEESEAYLQGLFLSFVEDGILTNEEWQTFLNTGRRLGFNSSELRYMLHAPAKRYVEHVLADAKADERITKSERAQIEWLLETLQPGADFSEYVRREIRNVQLRFEISEGRLPSLKCPPSFELRSGELVHAVAEADLTIVKMLKAGPTSATHRGNVLLLDSRAIFQSPTRAESISYRKIVALSGRPGRIDFQLSGKPAWRLQTHEDNAFVPMIFAKAVALSNQTAVRKSEAAPNRYIPRDVRQRVWQKYGGQCVDCGANDYLEFDHIIPVAKGGSNSDTNVQLLCRRCNIKKSDRI